MTLESTPIKTIQDEVIDFLLSSPTLQQITEFHASEAPQERMRYLLDASRNCRLTDDERAELDKAAEIDHFVTMLKIGARKRLMDKSQSPD